MLSNINGDDKFLCVIGTDILLDEMFRLADQNCITVGNY